MFAFIFGAVLYLRHIFFAWWSIVVYLFRRFILGRPVSYPGDPLNKPLRRRGKWPVPPLQADIGSGWKFSGDAESHSISQKAAPRYKMTGESAGRQIWYRSEGAAKEETKSGVEAHEFDAAKNPNSADKLFREQRISDWEGVLPDIESVPSSAGEAARKALQFYQMLQCDDGHWAGDYGGPNFLMPGLICVLYITKAPLAEEKKQAMVAYLRNHQQIDGGWGTHIECASTMFGTVLSYVALRLLGQPAEAEYMQAAHTFMMDYGGALYAPSWAKFWLAVIGCYDWEGINSIPAEMWLLPNWFPFHPGKLWCHCRMVYLPMCYVYCKRFVPDVSNDPLLQSLRRELFKEDYSTIDWDGHRQSCADIDEYSPLAPVMKVAQDFLSFYERRLLPNLSFLQRLRESALKFVIEYIHAEDAQTNYVDIGPVNKSLNMLSVWIDGGRDRSCEAFQRHIPRVDDYLWVAEDGMKMQGYNGSQCWDTSFAVQAIVEGDLAAEFPECAAKIYSYLERTQIASDEDNREYYYRHVSKGGWPFSTAAHGWPISDCTAEGLKGVLALHKTALIKAQTTNRISDERLRDAVNVILSLHNEDGGWATYENNRGSGWYEMFNPSEVFGDIMIDYSYVECTSACITALVSFVEVQPEHRSAEVLNAIQAGRGFLKSIQRADGSWYGSWGVCFIYGTWFGIEGLVAAGEDPITSEPIQRAVKFIKSTQNPNGGWGESYMACVNKAYPGDGCGPYGEDNSGVVQTAWALLGLMAAECSDRSVIDRGVTYLMKKQQNTGDWMQEAITGVFNRSCGITYTAYRNVFPLWALVRYHKKYER